MFVTDQVCFCTSNFMKSLLSAACHQCKIFSNHFTYSQSTSSPSPSPSMTISIYHQHHYHHYYHHGLCHHTFHPAMNHPLLHAMCPFSVSLCDSIQTYSVIVPAEAVWQPDQLHFDDARTCLALQLQLMASTTFAMPLRTAHDEWSTSLPATFSSLSTDALPYSVV